MRGIYAAIVLALSAHVNLTSAKSSYSISDDTYNSTCIKTGSELTRQITILILRLFTGMKEEGKHLS